MTVEALRLQLDAIRIEKQQLEVENARLREARPDQADRIDAEAVQAEKEELAAEHDRLRHLYEQLLRDVQEERAREKERELERSTAAVAESQGRIAQLERALQEQGEECRRLQAEAEQEREHAELERYRAIERERSKWEIREERLARQVEDLQRQCQGGAHESRRSDVSQEMQSLEVSSEECAGSGRVARGSNDHQETLSGVEGATPQALPSVSLGAVASTLLGQQLPPLAEFSGETLEEGETFQDWLERFQLVASMYNWDKNAKLAHLTTRLKGQAYAFYRSCTLQQRTDYDSMVAAMTKRFTPVRLKAVESSRFHERKQGAEETVDAYAQSLRRLFYRAYPHREQGSSEAEAMGQSVLANQFVSGLRANIKAKVAGMEGALEQLLAKARFEEAKVRDLAEASTVPRDRPSTRSQCYHCGSLEHLVRRCPLVGKRESEAQGRSRPPLSRDGQRVANIVLDREAAAEQRRREQDAAVEEALSAAMATMASGPQRPHGTVAATFVSSTKDPDKRLVREARRGHRRVRQRGRRKRSRGLQPCGGENSDEDVLARRGDV